MDIRRIQWGALDGRDENRQLVTDRFYDVAQFEEKLIDGCEYLIFGKKGSGKSLLARRLHVLSSTRSDLNVPPVIGFQELPLALLKKLAPGDASADIQYPIAWRFILLAMIVEQLSDDHHYTEDAGRRVRKCAGELRQLGISPRTPVTLAKFRTTKRGATLKLGVSEFATEQELKDPDLALHAWIRYMEQVCRDFRSPTKTILLVDGLDDLSPLRSGHAQHVASLVQAVSEINRSFREAVAPIKVSMCLIQELFDRLPLANKHKISSGFSVDLDWYQDTRNYENTHLHRLCSLRGGLDHPTQGGLKAILPSRVSGLDPLEFLFLHTRHTPRDVLQLLSYICRNASSSDCMTESEVIAGASAYSTKYFRGEVMDALGLIIGEEQTSEAMYLLSLFGSREVPGDVLTKRAETSPRLATSENLKFLEALYEVGAIGYRTRDKKYHYHYRNPDSSLRPDETLMLHRGLWKCLNVA